MLYKVIAYLFRNDDYHYTAKPQHIVWSVFVMAIGTVSFVQYDWYAFGMVTFILGALLGLAIVFAVGWEKRTEYWETVTNFANVMIKSNNPDLWQALGFKYPPQQITIMERREDEHGVYQGQSIKRLPVSPATMQMIADNRLMNNDMEFPTEDSPLGQNIPNYRRVKKYFRDNGLISQTHKKNFRLGYTFNRKGVDSLHQYASESIRNELKNRR